MLPSPPPRTVSILARLRTSPARLGGRPRGGRRKHHSQRPGFPAPGRQCCDAHDVAFRTRAWVDLAGTRRSLKIILALNKADLNSVDLNENYQDLYTDFIPSAEAIMISAANGDNLDDLTSLIASHLPEGPAFFPEDQLTDLYEREIAADLIREALLFNLRAEVPHSIAGE